MKASQLNPICLLMKAVLHGMCESGRGRGRRASHLPMEAREPARHEGGGGRGGFSALGLDRRELWVPSPCLSFTSTVALDKLFSPKEGVR